MDSVSAESKVNGTEPELLPPIWRTLWTRKRRDGKPASEDTTMALLPPVWHMLWTCKRAEDKVNALLPPI